MALKSPVFLSWSTLAAIVVIGFSISIGLV